MHRTIQNVILTLITVCCLWFYGCGDVDLVNEIGYSYQITSIAVEDRNTSTHDIDFLEDCNTDDDPITDASMTVTVQSGADQDNDMYVYKIKVEFDLLNYAMYSGTVDENDIVLNNNTFYQTMLVKSNGGSNSTEVSLLSVVDKQIYLTTMGNSDVVATFQVKVTVYMTATPDDPEDHYSADYFFTINIGNYVDESCP